MCISAIALSIPNGNSIHFTDKCAMKWKKQQYYVGQSISGMACGVKI